MFFLILSARILSDIIKFASFISNSINLFEINPPKKIYYKNILKKNFLPLLTVMIDREVIQDIEFKELRPEDYKLWIDLIYLKRNESIKSINNLETLKHIEIVSTFLACVLR